LAENNQDGIRAALFDDRCDAAQFPLEESDAFRKESGSGGVLPINSGLIVPFNSRDGRRRSAWNYRYPARISPALQLRQERQPPEIRAIAWRAQLRLNHRYRRLKARGLQHNKICVALARELAAFVWDIGRHVITSP
jgi:hypothetical protein